MKCNFPEALFNAEAPNCGRNNTFLKESVAISSCGKKDIKGKDVNTEREREREREREKKSFF